VISFSIILEYLGS